MIVKRVILILCCMVVMTACNLTSGAPSDSTQQVSPTVTPVTIPDTPIPPTATIQPDSPAPTSISISQALTITPVLEIREGKYIASPGAVLTIAWAGLPANSSVQFIESNFLADGGVTQLGQVTSDANGASIQYTMPAQINGNIEAIAILPDGQTIQAQSIPIQTVGYGDGTCMVTAPAVGPGQFVFSEPNINSTQLAELPYTGDGLVMTGVTAGTSDSSMLFYSVNLNGQTAYVVASAAILKGDCSAYE